MPASVELQLDVEAPEVTVGQLYLYGSQLVIPIELDEPDVVLAELEGLPGRAVYRPLAHHVEVAHAPSSGTVVVLARDAVGNEKIVRIDYSISVLPPATPVETIGPLKLDIAPARSSLDPDISPANIVVTGTAVFLTMHSDPSQLKKLNLAGELDMEALHSLLGSASRAGALSPRRLVGEVVIISSLTPTDQTE